MKRLSLRSLCTMWLVGSCRAGSPLLSGEGLRYSQSSSGNGSCSGEGPMSVSTPSMIAASDSVGTFSFNILAGYKSQRTDFHVLLSFDLMKLNTWQILTVLENL